MAGVAEKFLFFLLFMSSSASDQLNRTDNEVVLRRFIRSSCPEGWKNVNNRCLRYFAHAVNWVSAETYCMNLGAHLVSIHNEYEYMMVKAFIRSYDHHESPTWIGLHDCNQRNVWFWTDGTKYDYSKWNPYEPNQHNGECCVHMNFSERKNWNDIPCGHMYPFVCAKRT